MNALPDNHDAVSSSPQRRGQPKIVSIAEKQRSEKIRVELNIEKWPGIWQPARAHTRMVRRTFERAVELKDGNVSTSKLIVGFTDLGTLTTEDQRMFYALIRQWEEVGKPVGKPVYFSDRLLSRLLKKRGWGTNVIEAMTASLRRLRLTPLRWMKSFHKNNSGQEYEEEIPFQMLDDLKIITRRAHGHITNQQGYFQFNKYIEANLHAKYTKPLLDEVFFKLEGEIAQLLYTHIDLVMFGKTRYERCTRDLFSDLGLLLPENPSYRYKSNRKQKLERALTELRGIRLNHGILKSAEIEETKDGNDYKVVFTKSYRADQDQDSGTLSPSAAPVEEAVADPYAHLRDALNSEAEELVRHFHKIFHAVDSHDPQTKETSQALSVVSQYGLETSKRIVDFARAEAANTKYPMQHFGGVLNYVSRAVAAFDQQRQQEEQSKALIEEQARRFEQEEQNREQAQARLVALTPEQYQARFEKAKAAICAEHPKLARMLRGRPGSKAHEDMIRTRMIRELQEEAGRL